VCAQWGLRRRGDDCPFGRLRGGPAKDLGDQHKGHDRARDGRVLRGCAGGDCAQHGANPSSRQSLRGRPFVGPRAALQRGSSPLQVRATLRCWVWVAGDLRALPQVRSSCGWTGAQRDCSLQGTEGSGWHCAYGSQGLVPMARLGSNINTRRAWMLLPQLFRAYDARCSASAFMTECLRFLWHAHTADHVKGRSKCI